MKSASNQHIAPLRFQQFLPEHVEVLELFFKLIREDASAQAFHPHPFSQDTAKHIAHYTGKDLYLGGFEDQQLVAYGLLRGWDAGYPIPSLGIYLAPCARGRKLSKIVMMELHRRAQAKNAPSIRLKVYPDNIQALKLYQDLGYVFNSEEQNQMVGYFHF